MYSASDFSSFTHHSCHYFIVTSCYKVEFSHQKSRIILIVKPKIPLALYLREESQPEIFRAPEATVKHDYYTDKKDKLYDENEWDK